MTERRVIGSRFQIGELLGMGGMATVYLGLDTLTNTPVAIKQLKPEAVASDPDIVARFEREGEALRRLNHPNIVDVIASVDDDGQHFVVMEYVGGGDLRTYLDRLRQRQEPMLVQRVLEMALDLSDALTRAHRLRIIHRDIKPANVLLAQDGTPRLTDFGVARFNDSTRMTQTGALIGTLAYLSPEACSGEEPDERSDIWAFGVMLYEMLTLRRPFEGDNSASVMLAILAQEPPDIRLLRPDIPPALADLIDQMLRKDREDRISSVRLVGAQIEAILQGKDPVESTSTPTPSAQMRTDLKSVMDNRRGDSGVTRDMRAEQVAWPNVPPDVDHGEFHPKEDSKTHAKRAALFSTMRFLGDQPRIYLSYRKSQSADVAERIYDKLKQAFGADSVFKDIIANTPLGASFQDVLEDEIDKSDVLLVLIGPNWTQNSTAETSGLQLKDDFVRIEVEAGLAHGDDLPVIPVLVDGAAMPERSALPPGLHALTYRSPAVIRDDANFDRDVQWLIDQIKARTEQTAVRRRQRTPFLLLALLLVFAVIAGLIFALAELGGDEESPVDSGAGAIIAVPPVEAGQYMVMVGQMEQLGDDVQDVTRFIVSDLRNVFEESVGFSNIRIREYPNVIRTTDEAQEIAAANDAAIILWGQYDDETVTINIQVGALDLFPNNPFTRAELERIGNARLQSDNINRESVSPSVVALMNILHTADLDAFNIALNLTILDVVDRTDTASVQGNSAAARWHRYLHLYTRDPEAAIAEVTEAIALDPHPIYYMGRSLTYLRTQQRELAEQDLRTAQGVAPEGWPMPEITLAQYEFFVNNDPSAATDILDAAADELEETWLVLALRGSAAYLTGDYATARTYLEEGVALAPDFNLPYFLSAALALRDGRLLDAQQYINTVSDFPNPEFTEQLLKSAYGVEVENSALAASAAAFGNFTLGQWNSVISITEQALTLEPTLPEMYLLQGVAYCNLDNHEAAEQSYSALIEIDPSFTLAYSLRLESHLKQGDQRGVLADAGAILRSDQALVYAPYVQAIRDGELGCNNLLTADLTSLAQSTAPSSTVSAASDTASTNASTPASVPASAATSTPAVTLTGIEPNESLVLVAEFERISGEERPISRFIVDDLTQAFESDRPYAEVRVRSYPAVIVTSSEAQAVAEEYGARVIVWGSYNSLMTDVNVQLGQLDAAVTDIFPRETIEATTNVRLNPGLTPRRQSIAKPVMVVINMAQIAAGELFESGRNLLVISELENPALEIQGESIAALVHRYFINFHSNPEAALMLINRAIERDARNALLYFLRSVLSQRMQNNQQAQDDIASMNVIGPQEWPMPDALLTNDALFISNQPEAAIPHAEAVVALHPDDWYAWVALAYATYLVQDFDRAEESVERALALTPEANMAHVMAVITALRSGDLVRAQTRLAESVQLYPDPFIGGRIVAAAFTATSPQLEALQAFGLMSVQQWNQALSILDGAIQANTDYFDTYFPDVYVMRGLAHCNLGNYEEAETDLTRLITLSPEHATAYILRADVRRRMSNLRGVTEDLAQAATLVESPAFASLTEVLREGQFGCENFFTFKLDD
ncbi:MAG: hypothetical protein OHK0046_20030 [Anaerolineae bacterium]